MFLRIQFIIKTNLVFFILTQSIHSSYLLFNLKIKMISFLKNNEIRFKTFKIRNVKI